MKIIIHFLYKFYCLIINKMLIMESIFVNMQLGCNNGNILSVVSRFNPKIYKPNW